MLLGSMTFEELVEKLVSKEIDSLNYTKKSKDLNESSRASKRSSRDSDRRSKGRDRKGDRKSEKRDRSKSDFKRKDKSENRDRKSSAKKGNRFFINVGKSDGVSKSDMVDFIAETVKIRKSEVGDIDLQKNCSFFEVDSRHSKNVANSFKGIYIDGRELRVNRDSR
jgi:hypothetical protein